MGESMNTIKLYNGLDIPCIGFGTDRTFIYLRKNIFAGATEFLKDITVGHGYHWKRDTSIINIVKQAPSIGCHLFDTSSAYRKFRAEIKTLYKAIPKASSET